MKAGDGEVAMNGKSLLTILCGDRQLRAIFSGVIVAAAALIGVAVTAGFWFL
jgi:hypothetical protein